MVCRVAIVGYAGKSATTGEQLDGRRLGVQRRRGNASSARPGLVLSYNGAESVSATTANVGAYGVGLA